MPKQEKLSVNGLLLLNKPIGPSSNQALQRAKHLFNAKKAGHTGSLDPLATGMLPICFGEATKYAQFLLNADKSYQVTATLGTTTESGDADSPIIERKTVPDLTENQLKQVLDQFTGKLDQVPPMYSALKHQGKRLYELARSGKTVERPPRKIIIHKLTLLDYQPPNLILSVDCSKGTYIRSLIMDIGEAIGCGAFVSALHRLSVAHFDNNLMVDLDQLQELSTSSQQSIESFLHPTAYLLADMPKYHLTAQETKALQFGQKVSPSTSVEGYYSLIDHDNHFIGVGQIQQDILSAYRMMKC